MVESRDFFIPPLHSTPPLEGLRRNIAILFGMEKLEWSAYSMVNKTLMICSAVLTEYWCVTDRRADGQTSCHGIVRTVHTRRAIKSRPLLLI